MIKKLSQLTELDKIINPSPRESQQVLPFEDKEFRRNIYHQSPITPPGPPSQTNIRYPELSPEQIKFRKLHPNELQRLRDDDEYNYNYHVRNNPSSTFKPHHQSKYDLNQGLPEDAKKRVLNKYNELRAIATIFYKEYQDANKLAAEVIEFNPGDSYVESFKNLAKFVVSASKQHIAQLFGIAPESKRRITEFDNSAKLLGKYLNKGLNIFNLHPNNIETKIHEMDSIIYNMQNILKENERRKKTLKRLPQEIEEGVNRYLRKKEFRNFLKWMDDYFDNDRYEFMLSIVKSITNKEYSRHDSNHEFMIGDLKKIKTYSDIYYRARRKVTLDSYFKLQYKATEEIKDRLTDELKQRTLSKISEFKEIVNNLKEENMTELEKFCYKNYRLDLNSTFKLVENSISREFESHAVDETFNSFKKEFVEDLKENIIKITEQGSWKFNDFFNDAVNKFLTNYQDNKWMLKEQFAQLTEKDLINLVNKTIRTVIVDSLPNFESRDRVQYGSSQKNSKYPNFSGIGAILSDTGKFSIDSFTNYMHKIVPFVPKEFVLHLVRTIFKKTSEPKTDQEIRISKLPGLNDKSINQLCKDVTNLQGTTPALSMKVLLALLKKSGKFNSNSFANEFLANFDKVNYAVAPHIKELETIRSRPSPDGRYVQPKKRTQEEMVQLYMMAVRSIETLPQDMANFSNFLKFMHDSTDGKMTNREMKKIILNKNFLSYTKVGISRKLVKIYARLLNLNGIVGIKEKFGETFEELKKDNFISKDFESYVKTVINIFNSNKEINPKSKSFENLYKIISALETDLQTIEMSGTFKELLKDYDKKDSRLFKLNLDINDKLRFRVLGDKDPEILRVGIETNCCQRIGGAGEIAAKDSFVNPLASVLLLEWKNTYGDWVILSQSYFHYVPKENGYILDNVENNFKNTTDSGVDLDVAYAYLARKMNGMFHVGYFLAGKGYSKITTHRFKTHKMRGSDPRSFKAGKYTDFSPSNGMDLLNPKFDIDAAISKLLPQNESIKNAFSINLRKIVLGIIF